MKKVADAVLQLLQNDEIALESFQEGLLNLSAYANKIHNNVEKLTYKPVQKGTIVVALSRFSKSSVKLSQKPNIKITNLGTRSPVTSLTYEKTSDTERRVSTLNPYQVGSTDLFGIVEGESEIIIISSEKSVDLIKDHMNVIAKKEIPNLAAITVEFTAQDSTIARVLTNLLSALAVHKVNVVNVLPTLNEISFIVDKETIEQGIAAFNIYGK